MSSLSQIVSSSNQRELRDCLGSFATGVTVVTCTDAQNRHQGVTANSFSSVSLDPALILWSISKTSKSLASFMEAEFFAVNILSAQQQDTSNRFAKSKQGIFEPEEFHLSADGVPLLNETLSCFECRQFAVHEAGDHYILVGQVLRFSSSDRAPLAFYQGRYAQITSD